MLEEVTKEMTGRVAALEQQAWNQAGEEFNVNSTKQLGVILFEKLGLPIIKKTKTGYSTDVSVLEALQGEHPLIETLIEYRQLSKLLSTYLLGLHPLINPVTGRIHTHFNQMATVTGRLSSTEPNLQNIPTRTEVGKRMRAMFVPGKGYDLLLSCDYSQVELRVMASIAGDELLLDSFRHGQDVHARTASEVFGVPLEEVTPYMRSKAKTVNFGIIYGISDFGLAKQLGVSRAEAAQYIDSYFARYTGVKEYMEREKQKARDLGYVETCSAAGATCRTSTPPTSISAALPNAPPSIPPSRAPQQTSSRLPCSRWKRSSRKPASRAGCCSRFTMNWCWKSPRRSRAGGQAGERNHGTGRKAPGAPGGRCTTGTNWALAK